MVDYWRKYILNSQYRYSQSDGYSFNLSELTIVMPELRERWAPRKTKKNLAPDLVPLFRWNNQVLNSLYRGHDYVIEFTVRRGKGSPSKQMRRLKAVNYAGEYYAIIRGTSAHLKGRAIVPFVVRRRSLVPVVLAITVILLVVVVALFFVLPR